MRKTLRSVICAVMVLVMMLTMAPSYAFAEGNDEGVESSQTDTAQGTLESGEAETAEETDSETTVETAAEEEKVEKKETEGEKQEQTDTAIKEELAASETEVETKQPVKVNETAEAESKTEEKKETTDAAEAETPKTEFSYNDGRVTITATAPEEANLPQDAELKADYLKPGSDEYKAAVSSIEAQLTSELKADQKNVSVDYVLYDIYFLSTSENKRIEPENGKVKAEMTIHALQKTAEDGDIINKDVVHLKDNGTAEIVTDYINTNADGEVTSMGFTQSSFSVTGGAVTYSAVEENASENNDGSGDADGNEPVVLDENDLDGTDLSTVGKDNLNITITPSADPLPKDNASISGRIEYTIPNTMKDKTSPYTAHYNLPTNYLTFTSSLSGTIYAEDGTNIGSYVLDSATGLLTLTFGNESYYGDHTNISGYFNFKATVDTNQIPDESDAKWEFPGYGEITVPVEEGKISGSKQVSDIVFDEDGQPTLPYTINLYANSSMTGVMLTDILGTNQEFIESSWSVKDSSGNEVHFDCNIDGTTAILTNLGDDNDGDGIYTLTRGNYTITYRALIKDVNNIAALTNTATWKWDGGSNTSSTTKEVSGYSISKDDTNFSGNSASWRVLINKGTYTTMEQMANATLTDTLPEKMQLNEESIIIKDTANNWQVVDKTQYDVTVNENNRTFTIQFHRTDLDNKNIPQYEIIYKTELKDNASLENNEKVENTVEFKPGGTEPEKPEPVKDTGTGTYIESTPGTEDTRVAGAVFKNVTNVNYDDDGNAIADWRITINQDGSLEGLKNLQVQDGYNNDWFTQCSTSLVPGSVVVTIKENGSDKVLTTDNYDLIQNNWGLFFKLTFKGDYASGIDGPITITCKTITNGDDLKNNASTYETYITNHVKVSWDGHYDEDSDSFHYKKRAGELKKRVQRETDGTYIWTIIANYGTDNEAAIDLGTGTITVTDILPSGMSYVEDSGQYSIIDSYYNIQEWDHSLKNGKAITPLKTGNVLTFTVNNVGKNYIAIQYKTKINEGYMDDKGDVDFTNYASYSDSEGVINSGSATVTEHGTAIKKTGELTDDHQQVLYTITVNPDKKTLNDGKDLILKDTLPSNGYYVSGSLQATAGKIISSRYMDGKLYITVPDETKVVLTYLIAPNRTTDNSEQITLNNTVSVEGHDELTSSVDDSYNFDESTAGAGGSNDALFIKKIDSETQKSLEGAEFELHRMAWSEALQTYIEDINFTKVKGITNENGLVEFTELGHDKIYYYIETAAPNGYERDTARHYFWFRGNDAETIRERIASSGLSVNEIQPGFIVVGNDKVETGRITVTKKVTYNGEPDKVTEDFYVALFSDSNGEKLASEVKTISLTEASEGTATFTGLTVGETYYVYETDADGKPVGNGFGYKVKGQGQEVTIERDSLNQTAELTNNKVETGQITVTKKVTYNGEPDKVTEDFYVALFSDSDGKNIASAVKTISLKEASEGTATFDNLTVGNTYYVYETDADGKPVGNGFGYAVTGQGQEVTIGRDSLNQTAELTNNKVETGQITVTKKVTYNGEPDKVTEDFYVALFSDKDGTDRVSEVESISLKDASQGDVTFTGLSVGSTYYVYETDKDGTPVGNGFGYKVKGQGQKVTIGRESLNQTAELTNNKVETGQITVTKKVTYNGEPDKVTEDFYVALFSDSDGKNIASAVKTISLKEASEGTATFDNLTVGNTYYVYETDADGKPVGNGFGYAVTGQGQEVTIGRNSLNQTAVLTNNKSENGQITVTKKVTYNGAADKVTEDFYVALFSDKDGTDRVSEVESISLKDASQGDVTFTGLSVGSTYYVYETDKDGTPVGNGFGYKVKGQGQEVTIERDSLNQTAELTNNKVETGQITVTKKVTYNGEPDKVTEDFYVALFSDSDGKNIASAVKTISLKEASEGTATFDNLTVGNTYYVYETDADGKPVGNGFGYAVTGQGQEVTIGRNSLNQTAVLTNNKSENGQITVTKKVTYNGAADKVTEDFYVALFSDKDGTDRVSEVESISLKDASQGDVTFTGLSVGSTYYVYETDKDGTPVGNGFGYKVKGQGQEVTIGRESLNQTAELTNNKVETGQITVTKKVTYNGEPDKVTEDFYVALFSDSNGEKLASEVKTISLKDASEGTATFDNLTVGKTYYVYETDKDGTPVGNGFGYAVTGQGQEVTIERSNLNKSTVIINDYILEKVEVSGSKTWNDKGNEGARPESIKITLLADDNEKVTRTVTEADGWKWSFEDLPKYAEDGHEIKYTISEERVEHYGEPEINGFNVTNTYQPGETSISIRKIWDDNNNQDGIRPNEITVKLLANGKDTGKKLTLNSANNWSGSFTDLAKYKDGVEISYTVEEVSVEGYETVITGNITAGYVITNSHIPETTEVSGSKTWDDANNQDGKRPESIKINLLANGEKVDEKTVSADNNWSWNFTDLPKYENGTEISYTITEDQVDGYSTIYNEYDVINSYTPGKTSVTVTKNWQDSNDQDGIRPNEITVKLLANGKDTGKTLTLNETNNWEGSFTELAEHENGEVIEYTVEEVSVEGYETVITGNMTEGYVITNSHTSETTEVSGSKTWDDEDDQDGKRPDSITIRLLANGTEVAEKAVSADDNWSWNFTNFPKYENGVEITYTITEDAVPDYATEINGYDVTNSYTPGKTSVSVAKNWNDADNQDGKRPENIQVQLYADGKAQGEPVVLNAENNWSHIWSELDEKSAGNTIKYTVKEVGETDGKIDFDGAEYQVAYAGDAVTGYTIINSYITEKVEVSGSKTWDDKGNEGARPDSITIRLYADNKEIDRAAVTAENDWSWSFENLPKYRDGGQEIIYTISEDAVKNYITEVDGYDVTNKYQPGKTGISVAKRWDDSDNRDGKRPDSVKVQLYADGEAVGDPVALNKSNDWRYTWSELDKQADGKEILYTVKEVGEEKGTIDFDGTEYKVTYTGNAEKGYTITNSYNAVSVGVQTGDNTNMASNLAVMFAAMAAAGAVMIFRCRRYKE